MKMEDGISYIETKLINKFALHQLLEYGGTIRLGSTVIGVSHNPNNPSHPLIELKVGFIPIGETYKGHINPTISRASTKKEKPKIRIEEDDEEVI